VIFNGDFVTEGKMNPVVFEVSAFKTSQNRNFYAPCYLRNHSNRLQMSLMITKLQKNGFDLQF
jgi:hypothetical protein